MKLTTKENMPEGFLLVRFGLFRWTWQTDSGYLSGNRWLTAQSAINNALEINEIWEVSKNKLLNLN